VAAASGSACPLFLSARLFTAGADGTVRGFDPASGKEVWKQAAHDGQALALATGPEGRLASCGSDGRIRVFDAGGKVLGTSPAAGEWLYAVAFGSDGKTVRAGDWQGRLHQFVLGSKDKVMPTTVPLAAPRCTGSAPGHPSSRLNQFAPAPARAYTSSNVVRACQ